MNAVRLPHGVAWALELPGQVSGRPGGRGCAPELCIHRSVASASHPGPARVWGLGGNAQDCDPGPPAPQQQASRDRGASAESQAAQQTGAVAHIRHAE